MALIKCLGCGHMISDKATKCPKCGTPIVKTSQVFTTDKGVNADDERPRVEQVSNIDEYMKEPRERKKSNVGIISGVAVLLLALVLGGYWWYQHSHKNDISSQRTEESLQHKQEQADLQGKDVDSEKTNANDTAFNDTSNTKSQLSYSGLTFRTFTLHEYDRSNGVSYQNRLSNKEIAENLKSRGFVLSDKKTDFRPDYTGEDFYEFTVETYSKTVSGRTTIVKLEEGFSEIHFPNLDDVEEFKKTVRACGLAETEDGFNDTEEVYWAGTDVSIKGTIVTLVYKEEA